MARRFSGIDCGGDCEHGAYDHMVCRRGVGSGNSRGIRGSVCSTGGTVFGGIARVALLYQTGGGEIF